MRRNCGHPPERRRQKWAKDADGTLTKDGTECYDCQNERRRIAEHSRKLDKKLIAKQNGPKEMHAAMARREDGAPPAELTDKGLCGYDPLFVQNPGTFTLEDEEHMAKTCAACPVTMMCLKYFSQERYFEGVAGGWVMFENNKGNRPLRTAEERAA